MADQGASSSSSFIYDVFLSFRGETRHTFTDHLYRALTNKGINTFRDEENLRRGDKIGPTLVEAIERSRILIVVLSQNYASSSWCLDELVKIMECSDNGSKRPVLPIFYQVEPSDVRHQKNQYETAMIHHQNGRNSHKVQAWKSALSAVADLSGEHCKGRSESDIINKIVGEVLKRFPREPLHIKHPVELDSRFEEVKSLLDIESHDTLFMLCIYGDGETDKTSFVGELCNKIFNKFEVACFLENVSKKSKESIKGLEELQKSLLSVIDPEDKTEMGSTHRGGSEIRRRLGHKRVLLILDDVDSVEQLESLAGGGDWSGPGSRIIITARDEDVANKHVLDGVEIKKYCINGECDFEGTKAAKSSNKRKRDMEEGDIVGFDDSLRIVINQLKKEDSFHNVVSITGTGGLGKTTLAQKVYNDNEVKKFFPYRAWSCVSKDFTERKVFLDILYCMKPSTSKYEKFSEEKLKEEVTECLNSNKYLIVLDDIWEPEVWDKVKDVFPNNNSGSMILITSRNNEVARFTRSRLPHHQLPLLDVGKSWELFCRKVFGREECPHYLELIGRSIVERCGGLPLAIITLAGLVAKKERSTREWSKIEGFVPWYLAKDNTKVIDVLKVSYDNLPEYLKPCFLYFGIFPEDHTIFARELIQLWMAEGFIQPEKIRTSKVPRPEVVGEDYLNELVDRNLVHVVKRRSDGGVKICQIHDLLREICILESKVDNFLEVRPEFTNSSLSNSGRLCLLCNEPGYVSVLKSSQFTCSLFFFAGARYNADYIPKPFSSCHVVHLARLVRFGIFPRDFTKMIHLKYLRIWVTDNPGKIPDCMWSFRNLETLDLRRWHTIYHTISIWKLERLRHLYIRYCVMLEVDKEGANSKQMWNLQTLSQMYVLPETMLLVNSGSFPNLTKLSLMRSSITGTHLHEHLWNLHQLSKLRTFKINCCSARISLDGMLFPSNISKITLTTFDGLDPSCMSALGRIPNLQILKLVAGLRRTDPVDCSAADGDFPQLQVFHIERFPSLIRLTIENGAMPHLQRMVIRHCKYCLKKVPERLLSLCDSS